MMEAERPPLSLRHGRRRGQEGPTRLEPLQARTAPALMTPSRPAPRQTERTTQFGKMRRPSFRFLRVTYVTRASASKG
jgi:hypothetical protein